MITIRAYLRASVANKQGAAAIYFIIQPGEVWISTKIFCKPTEWDEVSQAIKRKHTSYNQVSPVYGQYRSRADHFVATLNVEQRPFIKSDFINYVFKGDSETSNPLLGQLIKQYKAAVPMGFDRSKHYDQLLGDIQTILPRARLKDIDAAFVQKLRIHLAKKPDRQNNANTITRKIKQVKALIHYAIRERYINADPLVAIRLKEIKGVKNYLEPAELAAFEEQHKNGLMTADMRETLRAFLFSCYTGLRYIDMKQLERRHLQGDRVVLVQEKTDKPVVVPLIDKAMALLLSSRRYGLLFDLASDQVVNKQLKKIATGAGVQKHITYHCSRHTFATLSIYFGIPYEIVAEILGVDFKTAKVYAKIMDDVKFREMQKWG